jgi:predicted DCC family thiol-disulfide oxidoreductase YuxK
MAPLILAYDAECRLCRRLMAWIQARDREGRVVAFPLQNAELVRIAPELAGQPLLEVIHGLDAGSRRVLRGGELLAPILARLPRWRLLAPLCRLPGAPGLARRIYGWLAARHHCRVSSRPFDR